MTSAALMEPIPIRIDEQGRMRVSNTRVLFDLVVYAFLRGSTPENITDQYPSLSLEDVYLSLGYYLRHRERVDTYLREQEAQIENQQREDEQRFPPKLTREILLARLEAKKLSTNN